MDKAVCIVNAIAEFNRIRKQLTYINVKKWSNWIISDEMKTPIIMKRQHFSLESVTNCLHNVTHVGNIDHRHDGIFPVFADKQLDSVCRLYDVYGFNIFISYFIMVNASDT